MILDISPPEMHLDQRLQRFALIGGYEDLYDVAAVRADDVRPPEIDLQMGIGEVQVVKLLFYGTAQFLGAGPADLGEMVRPLGKPLPGFSGFRFQLGFDLIKVFDLGQLLVDAVAVCQNLVDGGAVFPLSAHRSG